MPNESEGRVRVAAACGIGFVVVGVASLILITASPPPGGGASAAELTAYYTDPGNGRLIQVAMTLSSVGGFLLLWFLSGLRRRLVGALGRGSLLPSVVFSGGVVFVAVLFAANAALATAPFDTSAALGFEPGVTRTLVEFTDWLYTFGTLGLAATVLATSLAILRTRFFPRWVAWAGFVVAALFAANAVYAAFDAPTRSTGTLGFELMLWVLVVSVLLLRRPSTSVAVPGRQAGK